jgi:hypothetical protein
MCLYWCFSLGPVARRLLSLDELKLTRSYWEVMQTIERFRDGCTQRRGRSAIPDASFDRRPSR